MTEVAYIEDDETEALLFEIALKPRGITVLHIPDISLETCGKLQNPPYQSAKVIFFDLWMRTVSGIEIAKTLRNAGDVRPFFLVTAANNPNPSLLEQLKVGFLQKPLDFDHVARLILSVAAD